MQHCHYCKKEFPVEEMTEHKAYHEVLFYLCASCQAEDERTEQLADEMEAYENWERRQYEEGNVHQNPDGTWHTDFNWNPPDYGYDD